MSLFEQRLKRTMDAVAMKPVCRTQTEGEDCGFPV